MNIQFSALVQTSLQSLVMNLDQHLETKISQRNWSTIAVCVPAFFVIFPVPLCFKKKKITITMVEKHLIFVCPTKLRQIQIDCLKYLLFMLVMSMIIPIIVISLSLPISHMILHNVAHHYVGLRAQVLSVHSSCQSPSFIVNKLKVIF